MKKKMLSLTLSAVALFALAGCNQPVVESTPQAAEPVESAAQENPATEDAGEHTPESAETDYLSSISGTYIELFPELAKEENRTIWHEATAPLVGEENAEAATDQLLGMCMAEPYGVEASDKYAADPDSMAFNCYFLGGVHEFVMDGDTITGLNEAGNEVFSHKYDLMDVENENGFIFYQSEDADSGQFSYFAFSPDTMKTTYHLEFRYAEDTDDLQSWFEGKYAYWNAAAIAADYDDATLHNVIELFAEENLSSNE